MEVVIVQEPQILENGFYKDFGYGFYCTILEKQAKRWALTKRGTHIVNFYEYLPDKSLDIKTFSKMTEEWLQFVVNCRIVLNILYREGITDYQIWRELFSMTNKFFPEEQITENEEWRD